MWLHLIERHMIGTRSLRELNRVSMNSALDRVHDSANGLSPHAPLRSEKDRSANLLCVLALDDRDDIKLTQLGKSLAMSWLQLSHTIYAQRST